MARIRTIKPEFWGHWKVARISRDARLLFLGLLNEADDEGRQLGSPKTVAGVVFPNDDDVTTRQIGRWLDELEAVGLIERYQIAGVRYLVLPGFMEHQKVSHPADSRLPGPTDEPPELFPRDSGEPPDGLGPDLGSGSRKGSAPNGYTPGRGTRIPDEFLVTDDMAAWALRECPEIDWRLATKTFVAHWKAESKANAVKRNWTEAWRKWLLKDQGDAVKRRGPARTHL